jgi:hypothetical protein
MSTIEDRRLQQHKNVVDVAKKAGVRHIVYTSIAIKDSAAGFSGGCDRGVLYGYKEWAAGCGERRHGEAAWTEARGIEVTKSQKS